MTIATTRRALQARCAQLQQQLDASGHESRTKRAQRLHDLETDLKKAQDLIGTYAARIAELEAAVKELKAEKAQQPA